MTTAVSSNASLSAGTSSAYAASTAAAATAAASSAKAADSVASTSTTAGDQIILSDAAKAYLAATTSVDAATLAANARQWFDQQYAANNLTSPLLDGQVALDMTSLSRATLSAVAANSQSLFSKDETAAAGLALQKRFDDAMTPHVVIARHTGDYAGLYQAASDYLDQAGADERATPLWQSEKQAVTDGLALAKKLPQKAPDTGNANDPVQALLDQTSQASSTGAATDTASITANARAMLDAQANQARDAGTNLVFNPKQITGQQVDFGNFDNQTLAVVVLNQSASFSPEEVRAAKTELSSRNRASIMAALNSSSTKSDVQSQSLALLSHYSGMSAAEKTAMGYTDALQSRLIANYKTAGLFQNSTASSGSASLFAYL